MLSSSSSVEIKTSDDSKHPSILATTEGLNKMSITSKIPISTSSSVVETISNFSATKQTDFAETTKLEPNTNFKHIPEEANIKENEDKVCQAQKAAQLEAKLDPSTEVLPDNPSNSSMFPLAKGINAAVTAVSINNDNKEKLQLLANRQNTSTDSVSSSIKREQASIPHMLTTNTGPGKLPLFPSWALTQLGSSSVYAHSSGVNQPGFISNTRNLLPWDVPLKNTDWQTLQKKWPNLAESASKKSSFNPNGKGVDMGVTVKVFVGLEYECPRGHRLIASSPGKTKSMTSSITNRMVNSDAPLYIECHCTIGTNTTRPIISQLMRIHIVTPKAPMHITLNPKVIPCPDGPTFHPGWSSGQQLWYERSGNIQY